MGKRHGNANASTGDYFAYGDVTKNVAADTC